ncbi:alpha/beta hydrolase [Hahella aquimaris]|uniref:alpha/beta fold hydrolase n=1 Tax=Hahella sp. HNIBRBA332 TaxID=3015983 RepID=UPI00273B5E7D|nr:alpha/beta hydrolase [Hahella sp. HNIBRBA332]WLQ16637.1 alpha/beta hydrolase [Hahella sp. HNIBRBA332]
MDMMTTSEQIVSTPLGGLFVKRWRPTGADAAQAAPIVLFHDSLGSVELWRDFPMELAAATGREVIAYDRLGFGRSDPHPSHLDLSFISEEAHGAFSVLRESLRLDCFIAFGHSVGGAMAVCCATAFPDQCVALITEAAQSFVEDRTLEGIRAANLSFSQADGLERLSNYHGDKAAWVLDSWANSWLSDDFQPWNLDDILPQLRCPLLAIHGDRDEYGSTIHPRRLALLAGGPTQVNILQHCGHVPHREKTSEVLAAAQGFLEELPMS